MNCRERVSGGGEGLVECGAPASPEKDGFCPEHYPPSVLAKLQDGRCCYVIRLEKNKAKARKLQLKKDLAAYELELLLDARERESV